MKTASGVERGYFGQTRKRSGSTPQKPRSLVPWPKVEFAGGVDTGYFA